MKMNKKLIGIVSAAIVFASAGLAYGFAQAGAGNSANAPGQANAIANCLGPDGVVAKQNAGGQIGTKNGNANDKKQLATAVTNCDHFWDAF